MFDAFPFLKHLKEDILWVIKVSVAWVLTTWGNLPAVSSADLASYLAIIYTSVSLWVLVRDKIIRRRARRRAEAESDYTTL